MEPSNSFIPHPNFFRDFPLIIFGAIDSSNYPFNRYAVFVAGAATISIPGSKVVAHIKAGKNGLVFAADTAALSSVGHVTVFTKETFLMQIPTANGTVPEHTVLYEGPCKGKELMK